MYYKYRLYYKHICKYGRNKYDTTSDKWLANNLFKSSMANISVVVGWVRVGTNHALFQRNILIKLIRYLFAILVEDDARAVHMGLGLG